MTHKSIKCGMWASACILLGFTACSKSSSDANAGQTAPEAEQPAAQTVVTDTATGDTLAVLEYSDSYLTENAKKEGVVTTPSGLQYKIITEGTGASPTANDQVTVHYTGMLTNGAIFDSSLQRGEPITFPLNGVIAGWTEGLQLMKEGGKAMLYIPYYLGYGERGSGMIPPYATLVFEVELIKVN